MAKSLGKVPRLAAAAVLAVVGPAGAAVLEAGGDAPLKTLAAAVAAARDGDTIRLAAGEYFECAIINQRDLVLQGTGAETVVTDKACEGKALLVVRGDGLVVRDLVLARARVPDGNGAGIRLEGQGLTVERVRFENDQVGILGGGTGTIVVRDSAFRGGGVAAGRPTAAIMVGGLGLLRVERSVFEDVKGGLVASDAVTTELMGNRMSYGAEPGEAAMVRASGRLSMQETVIRLGPNAPPHDGAVLATGPGAVLRGNRMVNETGRSQVLLLNWMGVAPEMDGNVLEPGDALVGSSGKWRNRAGAVVRGVVGGARSVAGGAKRAVAGLFGG